MGVDELNKDQLEELRESYFYQTKEQTGDDVLQGIDHPSGVPMDIVKEHYRGIYFVPDDFWCSEDL